ncbi:MAG: hypothetical protein ACUVTX_10025 [Bacteroidales bacterium]
MKKKTDMLIQMLQNTCNAEIDAACVLFDSWFLYDSIIEQVVSIGYNVVCRLKNGNVKYHYQGKDYTLKELWKNFAKKTTAMYRRLSDQRLLSECQPA